MPARLRPALRAALAFVAVLLLATQVHAASKTAVVGEVVRIQQSAVAMQDAMPRILEAGSDILLGDVISTSAGARLQIRMEDGAEVTLGESTIFVVLEYVMERGGENAVLRLLQGAFKATSGAIANSDRELAFRVETEFATIGVRGTTFWGGTLADDFEVALLDGKGVVVITRAGEVELDTIGDGTAITGAEAAPSAPKQWSGDKLERAAATVTFAAE